MFFPRTRRYWYALSAVVIPGAIGYALGGVHAMIGCILFSGLFRSYLITGELGLPQRRPLRLPPLQTPLTALPTNW